MLSFESDPRKVAHMQRGLRLNILKNFMSVNPTTAN